MIYILLIILLVLYFYFLLTNVSNDEKVNISNLSKFFIIISYLCHQLARQAKKILDCMCCIDFLNKNQVSEEHFFPDPVYKQKHFFAYRCR